MKKTKIEQSSPEHAIRQSINAKVERSEKDVIKSLEWTLGALFVLQALTLILIIVNI